MGTPTWKRCLDTTCILLAMPVLLPLMALIALAIKVLSPGPVFFRQERIGYRGRPFICLKFRTMKIDANTLIHERHLSQLFSSDAPMTKMDLEGDSRLIPFASILRATGLDELPQILNILRGEMSLVGPRPCLAYEYEKYCSGHKERYETSPGRAGLCVVGGRAAIGPSRCLPYEHDGYCYKERCATLPGLTGLWQVSGKNRTTFTEMMRLDIYYARNKSFWLDMKIILRTIPALLVQVREARIKKRQQPGSASGASQFGCFVERDAPKAAHRTLIRN